MSIINIARIMIEVYQTNVNSALQAEKILFVLRQSYPSATVTFDLEDCDRILRIAGVHTPQHVVYTLKQQGYDCQPLP